jgi:RNA-binding protein
MSETLTGKQKSKLRGMAMNLSPVVTIGKQGLTDSVVKELSFALARTELVKVRIDADNRDARAAILCEIEEKTGATLAGTVGGTASFYRPSDSKLIRFD